MTGSQSKVIRLGAIAATLGMVFTCAVYAVGYGAAGTLSSGVKRIRVYQNPAVIYGLRIRPRRLTLAADGNDTITKLRVWKGWGGRTARAKGLDHVNNCVPSCAAGHISLIHVRVRLFRRGDYRGHYVYECYAVKPVPAPYLRRLCLP